MKKAIRWKRVSQALLGGKVYVDATLSSNSYVYHRLEYPYARSIFANDRLRLGSVATWQDPYEKWWCKELFARPGALSDMGAYALCWTSSWNDEPAWRMVGFGKEHPIVRIRTRVADLLRVATQFALDHTGAMFLGRVVYSSESNLKAAADEVRTGRTKDVTRTAATMLLHKRNAFRFEQEIRLLWLDRGNNEQEIWLPIPARTSIGQVLISPHVLEQQQSAIKAELAACGVEALRSQVFHAPK